MQPIKTQASINSLDGGLADVTILKKTGDNSYVAEYDGKKCSAIFNPFVGRYYVDDKYGVISEKRSKGMDR